MIPIYKQTYLLGNTTSSEKVLKKIQKKHHLQETKKETGEEHYYDTFDWRLYRKKLLFTISKNKQQLKKFSGKAVHVSTGRKKNKLFSWDFEDAQMKRVVEKHIEMRALCPTVSITNGKRKFKVLNKDRKTVAWVDVISNTARNAKKEMELPESLVVTSVRGYENSYEKLAATLAGLDLEVMKSGIDLMDRAYGIYDRQPLDYGAKFYVKLNRDVTIGSAVSTICLNLLESMEINHDGVYRDVDSEFLHDFRIAVRRTRSLLSLLRKYLPPEQISFYEEEFKWLGSVTGAVRDIDVYLLKKETYPGLLPAETRGGLTLFFNQLVDQRIIELACLKKHLLSDRYNDLLDSWRTFLTDPGSDMFVVSKKKPCLKIINKIVRKRFTRFITDADSITDETPDDQLHKLRIKGKKFRYLLEFFKSFYPESDVELFLKHMKKVQDNLGDFNDLSVQAEMLNNKIQTLRGRNKQTIMLAAALGSLVTMLRNEHEIVRGKFRTTYAAFSTEENKRLMESLTKNRR